MLALRFIVRRFSLTYKSHRPAKLKVPPLREIARYRVRSRSSRDDRADKDAGHVRIECSISSVVQPAFRVCEVVTHTGFLDQLRRWCSMKGEAHKGLRADRDPVPHVRRD